jgi:hypothetical protein
MRLGSDNQEMQIVGLRALKELVRAFQYEVDQKRKHLIDIGHHFLPHLETMMSAQINSQGPNQFKMLILICKIFYMCNTMRMLPNLILPKALEQWIGFFGAILESQIDENSHLVQLTDENDKIEALDKEEWWKLKGICSRISIKLYNK